MATEMSIPTRNEVVKIAAEIGFLSEQNSVGANATKKYITLVHTATGETIYVKKEVGQKQDGNFNEIRVMVSPLHFFEINGGANAGISVATHGNTHSKDFKGAGMTKFPKVLNSTSHLGNGYNISDFTHLRKLLKLIDENLHGPKSMVKQAASTESTIPLRPQKGSNALIPAKQKKLSLAELEKQLARQREIGVLGEDCAVRYESDRLRALGCSNPVAHIERLTDDDVGAGYDIRSVYEGETRCIEVKGSVQSIDSFFVSENERKKLIELGTKAYIYMVFVDEATATNTKVIREIQDPMSVGTLELEPVAYRATLCDDATTP